MRFSSSIFILTPIERTDRKGTVLPPLLPSCRYFFFRLMCRYTAPPTITRHNTMANIVFNSIKNTSLPCCIHAFTSSSGQQAARKNSIEINTKAYAQEYGQWDAFLLCHFCIDAGGNERKKEDGRKGVQAETKAHCRRQFDVAASDTAIFDGKKEQAQSRQQESRNPLKQGRIWQHESGYTAD
jgi:hypothetical protein